LQESIGQHRLPKGTSADKVMLGSSYYFHHVGYMMQCLIK